MSSKNKVSQYDSYIMPKEEEPEQIPDCEHEAIINDNIITEYSPQICEWVIQHGRAGFYIQGFFGRYSVAEDSVTTWLSSPKGEYTEFKHAFQVGVSASIFYWNEELVHAIDHKNYEMIPIIKGILLDIIKSMKEFQFNNLIPPNPEEEAKRLEMERKLSLQQAMRGGNNEANNNTH